MVLIGYMAFIINKDVKPSTKKTNIRTRRTEPEHQYKGDIVSTEQHYYY